MSTEYMNTRVHEYLQTRPDVPSLTAVFFLLYFLAATQDIAVDGWALTMLRQENILEHSEISISPCSGRRMSATLPPATL